MKINFKIFIILIATLLYLNSLHAESPINDKPMIESHHPEPTEDTAVDAEKKIICESEYEYNWVKIRSSKTDWQLYRNRVAYLYKNRQFPYIEYNVHKRHGEINSTLNFGGYYKFSDWMFAHAEMGFGTDVDYIYNFKTDTQLDFRLTEPFFTTIGHTYLSYDSGNVNIITPGAIIYFGDNYITGNYKIAFTEDRGTAHSAFLMFYSNITKYLKTHFEYIGVYCGGAIGSRLYDTADLDYAVDQEAYVVFTGLELKITKDWTIKISYLYGEEEPQFTINTLRAGASLKF